MSWSPRRGTIVRSGGFPPIGAGFVGAILPIVAGEGCRSARVGDLGALSTYSAGKGAPGLHGIFTARVREMWFAVTFAKMPDRTAERPTARAAPAPRAAPCADRDQDGRAAGLAPLVAGVLLAGCAGSG